MTVHRGTLVSQRLRGTWSRRSSVHSGKRRVRDGVCTHRVLQLPTRKPLITSDTVKTVLATLLLLASLRPVAAPVLCMLVPQSAQMEDCQSAPESPSPYTTTVTDQSAPSAAPCLYASICAQPGPAVMRGTLVGAIAQPFTSLELPIPADAFASSGSAPPFHPPRA